MITLPNIAVWLGCDPEVFIATKDGKIVGSEKVLPNGYGTICGRVVCDGVQVELHPGADTCRAIIASSLSECFKVLEQQLQNKDLTVDFSTVVNVSKEELDQLSEKARKLGCMPSMNAHGLPHIIVNGERHRNRSAAGHIHVGCDFIKGYGRKSGVIEPRKLAWFHDIIVGNTCVLLDRDPFSAERRKVYGRAGEYRTPRHGFEYRTLSNFWLRGYPLFSLILGLVRQTTKIAFADATNPDFEPAKALLKADPKIVTEAINANNFDLAKETWETIVKPVFGTISDIEGLFATNIATFDWLVQKGIDYYFKDDPLSHWKQINDGHERGWESFCTYVLEVERKALVPYTPESSQELFRNFMLSGRHS